MANPPKWQGVRLQQILPGGALAIDLSSVVEPITTFLQGVSGFLDLVKQFLFDFTNPIQALLDVLIQQIVDLIEGLRQTGLFVLPLLPNFSGDIELTQISGGFNGFKQRIAASLTDTEDGNRPQFGPADLMGGVVLAFDTQNLGEMIETITRIYGFFDRAIAAKPSAPINLQVVPANKDGKELEPSKVTTSSKIGGALLRWGLPGLLQPFTIPEKFLIERSSVKSGALQTTEVEIDTFANLSNLSSSGVQTLKVPVTQHGVQHSTWKPIGKIDPGVAILTSAPPKPDEFGLLHNATARPLPDVVISVIPDGTYTFFDPTAAEGQTYYYRVRSLYKDVPSEKIVKGQVVQGALMSEPCPPASVSIPRTPEEMPKDEAGESVTLQTAMLDLYRAAYALQFYRTEAEFASALFGPPIGTETLTRLDARHLFTYLDFVEGKGVPLDTLLGNAFKTISSYIERFSQRTAVRLARRPQAADVFTAAYSQHQILLRGRWNSFVATEEAKTDLKGFLQTPPQPPVSDTDRATILHLVNLVERLEAYPGAPPNWESARLIEDFLPFLDEYLTIATEFLRGLQGGASGIIKDVKDYIDFLQRKVDFLLELLESIETTLQLIVALDVGLYVLWVPPKTGGVAYFMDAFLNAEPTDTQVITEPVYDANGVVEVSGSSEVKAGPGGGAKDYTAGIVMAFGSFTAGIAEDDNGDLTPFKDTQDQFEATKVAMNLLFGSL